VLVVVVLPLSSPSVSVPPVDLSDEVVALEVDSSVSVVGGVEQLVWSSESLSVSVSVVDEVVCSEGSVSESP
jgi:hypothetical protein